MCSLTCKMLGWFRDIDFQKGLGKVLSRAGVVRLTNCKADKRPKLQNWQHWDAQGRKIEK